MGPHKCQKHVKNIIHRHLETRIAKKHQKRSQREKLGTFLGPHFGPATSINTPKTLTKNNVQGEHKKDFKIIKIEAQKPSKMGPKTMRNEIQHRTAVKCENGKKMYMMILLSRVK